jgi:hypothetical protein
MSIIKVQQEDDEEQQDEEQDDDDEEEDASTDGHDRNRASIAAASALGSTTSTTHLYPPLPPPPFQLTAAAPTPRPSRVFVTRIKNRPKVDQFPDIPVLEKILYYGQAKTDGNGNITPDGFMCFTNERIADMVGESPLLVHTVLRKSFGRNKRKGENELRSREDLWVMGNLRQERRQRQQVMQTRLLAGRTRRR